MQMRCSTESLVDRMIGDLIGWFEYKSCILSEVGVISLNHGRFCR